VKHNEDASRDVPAPLCERICEFFTVCRGDLPIEDPDLITDPVLIDWVQAYVRANEVIKEATKVKTEMKEHLLGVSGRAGHLTIRWTHVNETQVPGFERAAYDKIDVRKARG
jgi:hypothetical protein